MTMNQETSVTTEAERETMVRPERTLIRKGEVFLAFGIAAFVLALATTHFVMGIYLAVVPGALALIFLSAGTIRARNRYPSAGKNVAAGLGLLFVGFCILVVIGFQAARLSYREAIAALRGASVPPGPVDWLTAVLTWFLPVLFVVPGLARWTDWEPKRRLLWCLISFLVPLAIFLVHQFLVSKGGPISA